MAASYHHTKEALSLPECCLHPSHLHSQLGSLMSEYDKWIEDVSTVDFTVTSDTDKCRHYACYVDYNDTKSAVITYKMCWGAVQWGTGDICPSPCYTLVCICIRMSHGHKMPYLCSCVVFFLSSLAGTEFICLTWTVRHNHHSMSCHMSLLLIPASFLPSLFGCRSCACIQ